MNVIFVPVEMMPIDRRLNEFGCPDVSNLPKKETLEPSFPYSQPVITDETLQHRHIPPIVKAFGHTLRKLDLISSNVIEANENKKRRLWTSEEKNYLKVYMQANTKINFEAIAINLNRTPKSIYHQYNKLLKKSSTTTEKVNSSFRKAWTQTEKDQLNNLVENAQINNEKLDFKAIAEKLKTRTSKSVKTQYKKMQKLGLTTEK